MTQFVRLVLINADVEEAAAGTFAPPFSVCKQHYRAVHGYCSEDNCVECALCCAKPKHRVGSRFRCHLDPFHSQKLCLVY